MSENKLLLSFLLELSEALSNYGQLRIQEELPKLFCEVIKADGCAVYVQKINNYILHKQYSSSASSHFASSWRQIGWNLSTAAVYIDAPETAGRYFQGGIWQRCLLLPLLREDKIEGVLLAGWAGASPLDGLLQEELRLLQPISQLLSDIYCTTHLITALKEREKSLSILYQKAEQELENGRRQVSLALHDEVGQVLTSILLQLNILQQSEDLDYVKGRLGGLSHITQQTLEEVRRISHNLRPALLENLGLQAALESHIKEYTDSTGIAVEFRHHNLEERLPDDVEIIVYRAVQEGLTNVARHAGASSVMINLTVKGNKLLLQIEDNGKGMEERKSSGLGLLGMEERVKLAKGKFWLLNQKEQGLTLNILLPLV